MNKQHSSYPDWELIANDNGWQISPPESVNLNDYQFYLEKCAGQSFSPALALTDTSNAILSFDALSALVNDKVDALAHPILLVKSNQARSTLIRIACRHLPMSATANFRDYGGYLTKCGRQVVWGKLFRTGHMGEMSDRDVTVLTQLNIQAVCDFRRPEEATKQPSVLPKSLLPTAIPISPGSVIDLFSAISGKAIDEDKIDTFMQDINRDLVINHQSSYRAMFDQLLASTDAGSIIHCSAGKDRTGFGSLLLLSALGVSDDDIMADYLLTNQYVKIEREIARWTANYGTDQTETDIAEYQELRASREAANAYQGEFNQRALAVILKVKPSYLQTAINTIKTEFGGTISYLERQIGLSSSELSRLKGAYLYDL